MMKMPRVNSDKRRFIETVAVPVKCVKKRSVTADGNNDFRLFDEVSDTLKSKIQAYLLDFDMTLDEKEPEIVISVGGDGTLLHIKIE
jgi:NAD kinase